MRRLALITAIVLLILTLLVIVWRLQAVVYIFLVALVITMAAERPIDLLTLRGAPRWLAVLAIYGLAVLLIGVTVAFVLSKVTGEIDPFVQDVLTRYGLLQNRLTQLTEARRGILIANLPSTEVAGTTRDVLRESIQVEGIPIHVIDTAGLRQSDDPVEIIGVERAWKATAAASTSPGTKQRNAW